MTASLPVPTPTTVTLTSRSVRDVVARGARVRFADEGSGPPLLLVHDVLEQRAAWDGIAPLLATRFRVLTVDLPGFGDSEKPPSSRYAYGLHAFAEALVDLLAAAGVHRASIGGHGLGAAVALTMATSQPAAVESLVLLGAALSTREDTSLVQGAAVPVLGQLFVKQLVGQRLFRRHFGERGRGLEGGDGEALLQRYYEGFDTPAGREAAHGTLVAMRDRRALLAGLPRVMAPTLVLGGREDPRLPPSEGRRIARELPRGRYESFEGGSFPAGPAQGTVVAAMTEFLLSPRGRARGG